MWVCFFLFTCLLFLSLNTLHVQTERTCLAPTKHANISCPTKHTNMSSPTKLTGLAGFKFANSTKICPNPDIFKEPGSLKSRLSNFSPEYNPNLHCTRGQTLCYKTHRCHTSRSTVGIIFRQVNLQLYILECFKDRTLYDIEHRLLVLCHGGWSRSYNYQV